MPANSSGGSLGITREHLLHADDTTFEWILGITGEIFDGNHPPSMLRGVANPLPKDEHRWRSITLLEPILKLVNGTFGRRLLTLLTKHDLLGTAPHGFITNGSCEDPLTVVCQIYSQACQENADPLCAHHP